MTLDELLKKITDRFGNRILKVYKKNERRAYVDIYPKDIVDLTKYVFNELGLRFNIASAVDDFDGFEILYHFALDAAA